jgi:RNA polymerase sigma-70 factor (ECF subfamily)
LATDRASTGTNLLWSACARDVEGASDGQLLERFLSRRDEAAFAALVWRHGPMVLGVCRRALGNAADAEDAFQAVFLVLARKGGALAGRPALGDWLHGVARRTAQKARASAALRRAKERAAPTAQPPNHRNDWLPRLDEELARLPEKYRLPIVLCDLEGHTRKEAAERLGWPEGTVAGRQARGRALLARRLLRAAPSASVALTATLAGEAARAALPLRLVARTFEGAALVAAGGMAARGLPPGALALAKGVMRSMRWHKCKSAATGVLAAALLAGLGGLALFGLTGDSRPTATAAPAPLPREERPLGTWALSGVCAGHETIVTAVALSKDGKLAVSGSDDQTLRF